MDYCDFPVNPILIAYFLETIVLCQNYVRQSHFFNKSLLPTYYSTTYTVVKLKML